MQDLRIEEFNEKLSQTIEEYVSAVKEEFRHLWNSWNVDINNKELYEVIGGLVARQVSLSIHFIGAVNNWTNEIAPIILRSMADNYINLAWILKDPLERSRKFIAYGLGMEKLGMEHRKNQLKESGANVETDMMVKASKAWIDFQQYDFLTSIDLANWAGLSVYQMAEQADCKDFYNYVYQPFSSAVHSTWNHIGKHNICVSENPLHKFLLVPTIHDPEIEFTYPDLAAKYTNKCFEAFHDHFGIPRATISSYETLLERYDELTREFHQAGDGQESEEL